MNIQTVNATMSLRVRIKKITRAEFFYGFGASYLFSFITKSD